MLARMSQSTLRIPWARLGAEFVVIVVGILLALAIESWWGELSDERKVQTYLVALEEDLLTDSVFYADVALPRMVRKREVLDAIAPVVRGDTPVPVDTLAFLDQLAFGGLFGIPGGFVLAESTTMDELVATGSLALIESPKLRAELTQYYTVSASVGLRSQGLMPNYPLHVHGAYPAELRDSKTDADVRRWGIDRALDHFVSPEFEGVMNQEYNYMLYMERSMTNLSEATQELLARVRCARAMASACEAVDAFEESR